MKPGFTYIMSNYSRTVLYVGVTNDIERRSLEHKAGIGCAFTTKYKCIHLLYFEELPSMMDAIDREKQLKNWHKAWKWNLIKNQNPEFKDLAADWFDEVDIYTVKGEPKLLE